MGAFCGDAVGSFLEGPMCEFPREVLNITMSMPGGGAHNTVPGQVTDDSELAMCLLHAITECEDGKFELKRVVAWYDRWMRSMPFGIVVAFQDARMIDMGSTISSALTYADEKKPDPERVRKEAAKLGSESNGSLMRITPLAVFLHRVEDMDTFVRAVRSEVSLTHREILIQHAAVAYCLAIKMLIQNPGKRELAYETAK